MSLAIRHGVTGKEVLQIEAGSVPPTGWDLMVRLAAQLGLETPYQVTLYPSHIEDSLSPLDFTQLEITADHNDLYFILRPLQDPTAAHYQAMITVLYQKNAATSRARIRPEVASP